MRRPLPGLSASAAAAPAARPGRGGHAEGAARGAGRERQGHGDAGARRCHAAASVRDVFVARNVGHGGATTAVARRLRGLWCADVSRPAVVWPLPDYGGPVSCCWLCHGTSGIAGDRHLWDSGGLAYPDRHRHGVSVLAPPRRQD